MLDFTGLGLWLNIPAFAGAAIAVWMAGVRITRDANIIGGKTGVGQALIGVLLLGGITSLPELVVAVTSSLSGDASLAVNSILGGIAMQVAILALADAMIGRRALTSVIPDPVVMLQGGFKILLLSIVAASIVVGDSPVLFSGLWMWLLIAVTGVSIWVMSRMQHDKPWIANDEEITRERENERARKEAEGGKGKSLRKAVRGAAVCGGVIVFAGYVLSRTGDAIAEASGLGQSFIGAVVVAIATSLPEMSTVFSATRAGLYTMAMSDIFGTNLFDLSFLFLIDLTGGADAVMNGVGRFETFAALMAITVTAIFLVGLSERRDRTIFRMGYDSLAVLTVYLTGLIILYFLRDSSGGGG
ncbi:sodium:calcium antiporter [Sinorhizobium numidicum]|uniref:Sodium:calcium antiporter n=1 Tax=Sinorhizobium numidicum TaxID=680248 RepID=A0ABY8CMQ4_9HYPH|nr:sodium:calcium antiporter [Sinorhizobium numidicum]WEX73964.1 sodium:calcium antiporter [Sinorhizobium numidicum]WEX79949.1 sodium:calcium antiporter [Sinorhizobium numidicum]